MSNFDIPINYSRDVIMRHDNQLLDDSTYIEEKNKIVNEKREKKKTFYEDSIINPNFTPDEFIKQQTHIKETNKIETDEFHPYLNYLESKGLLNKNPQVRYNIDYIKTLIMTR
jgi:DNA-directed RNA polymerase subunit E'/Rpb7